MSAEYPPIIIDGAVTTLRNVAALANMPGLALLIKEVKKQQKDVMEKLKFTNSRDSIAAFAVELRVLERMAEMLENLPKDAVEQLKEKGDPIYG